MMETSCIHTKKMYFKKKSKMSPLIYESNPDRANVTHVSRVTLDLFRDTDLICNDQYFKMPHETGSRMQCIV